MRNHEGHLVRVVPILTSYDVNATEAFYIEKLGFRTVTKYEDFGYLIMTRDQVVLHFSLAHSGSPATTPTSCYITAEGVDAFYEQALTAGAVHPNGALEDKAWGMREFSVLDGDGNLLRVGQDVS